MSSASGIPARFIAGMTQDQSFQPLAGAGIPNPAFHHTLFSDFDVIPEEGGSQAGSITPVAAAGGVARLLPSATRSLAQFSLGPTSTFSQAIAPKKLFFEARIQVNPASQPRFMVGLANASQAAISSPGSFNDPDGIWFFYDGSSLTFGQANGEAVVTAPIPANAYDLSRPFDLAFYQNPRGDILAYIDTQLAGYVLQSQIGTPGNPQNTGAVARIHASAYTPVPTLLAPVLAIWEGAGSNTDGMLIDFVLASQER